MKMFAELQTGEIVELVTIPKSEKPNAFYNSSKRPSFNGLPVNHAWTSRHLIRLAAKELGIKAKAIKIIVETLNPVSN